VRFDDAANRPRPNTLHHAADRFAAMSLVAHLRGHFVLAGSLGQGVALVDVVRQRLLAERGLAEIDGPDRSRGVVVVRRGDEHRVEILVAIVEHLAVVVEDFGLGPPGARRFHRGGDRVVVDVDQGDQSLVKGGPRLYSPMPPPPTTATPT